MINKYFSEKEIACNCCGQIKPTTEAENHANKLTVARVYADIPFIVTSWNRCEKHNKKIGGSITSSHLKGIATDIKYKNDTELFKIVDSLMFAWFKRILIYPKSKFIHVDSDNAKSHPILKIME